MTARTLWTFLGIGLPVLAAFISNLSAVDLAYHLRAGGMALDTGVVPRSDTFTFTATGQPWLNQQWAAQVLLAAVYRVGGWTGLVILRGLLVGALTAALFVVARRQGLNSRAAAWLTLVAFFVASVAFTLRPQLLGMVLLAVTLLILVSRREHPKFVWLIPALTVVWANVHGSFVLAPIVLGLTWLDDVHQRTRLARQTFAVGVATVFATLVNPFGAAVWPYAVGLSTNSFITSQIVEWQPTTLRSAPGIVFFASALLVAGFLARRGRPTPWPALAWLAVFFLIGAYAIRGVAWWPMAAAVTLAPMLADIGRLARPEEGEPARRVNLTLAGVIVLAMIALLPAWRPLDPGTRVPNGVLNYAPSGVTGHLRAIIRPGDRIFAPQPWGSWLEFAFPGALVAVDSRIEMFPAEVWDEYDTVAGAGGDWLGRLDEWDVTVITGRVDSESSLDQALRRQARWREAFRDKDAYVFVRSDRS